MRAPQGCFQSLKLALLRYGIRSVRQTSTVCRHELHTPTPSLCSLSSPCELKLALLRYGLRALRQAPRLPRMYAPVKFALRANFYVALVRLLKRQSSALRRSRNTPMPLSFSLGASRRNSNFERCFTHLCPKLRSLSSPSELKFARLGLVAIFLMKNTLYI